LAKRPITSGVWKASLTAAWMACAIKEEEEEDGEHLSRCPRSLYCFEIIIIKKSIINQ
jgi:hypothetical protein